MSSYENDEKERTDCLLPHVVTFEGRISLTTFYLAETDMQTAIAKFRA